MNKERNVIVSNPIVVFNGDVNWSEVEDLFKDFKGDIVIHGNLIIAKDSRITCDTIYVMKNLCEDGCVDVIVEGNLYVKGAISCCDLTVNGSLNCYYYISTFEINVAEDLYAEAGIESSGYDINVGGDLISDKEIEAADIMVLGKFYVSGRVEADSIWIG